MGLFSCGGGSGRAPRDAPPFPVTGLGLSTRGAGFGATGAGFGGVLLPLLLPVVVARLLAISKLYFSATRLCLGCGFGLSVEDSSLTFVRVVTTSESVRVSLLLLVELRFASTTAADAD